MDSSHQQCQTPGHCTRGCGFFGTAESLGLCSKCYKDYLHHTTVNADAEILGEKELRVFSAKIEKNTGEAGCASISSAAPAARRRCGSCSKKLGLLGFVCRCEGSFCSMHRYPEAHACSFDFKNAGKAVIQKENPLCIADKISDRI